MFISFNKSSKTTIIKSKFPLQTTKHTKTSLIENGFQCYSAKVFRILTMEKAEHAYDYNECDLVCTQSGNKCRRYSFDPVNGCWLQVFKPICYCSPTL